MTDRGSKKVLIQKMSAMFSCAHRACMVVYSTAACNTCQPMTSAERMRKPQLQSTVVFELITHSVPTVDIEFGSARYSAWRALRAASQQQLPVPAGLYRTDTGA